MLAELVSAIVAQRREKAGSQAFGTQHSNILESTRRQLLDHGEDAVIKEMQQLLQQASPQACKVLQAVFQAIRTTASFSGNISPADMAGCRKLRVALFSKSCTWLLQTPVDDQQLASDLLAVFLADIEHLPADGILQLLYECLSAFEENKPHCCILLEMVPQCLLALGAASNSAAEDGTAGAASVDEEAAQDDEAGDKTIVDPASERDKAVSRILCSKNWQPEHIGQILQVLKSTPMTKEQVQKAIKKTINASRSASLQQLPPVLYQLMLLSAAGGARSTALLGISKLFEHLEGQPSNQVAAEDGVGTVPTRTLKQVEATLLMHISTLLKYDAALGSEWLKWLKAHANANQFLLQVSFTMSRHHKLEQPVQQLLKKAIQQACEEEVLDSTGSTSRWLNSMKSTAGKGPSLSDLQQGLLRAIRCSEFASELVCPGLLQLASSLLTTPCSCPLHNVMAARHGSSGTMPPQAPAGARAVRLGLLLLQEVFQVHAEARSEVLRVCQGQLSSSNLDTALPHVLLLSTICRDQPALLSSYIPQLKDCLSSLGGLSADAALVLLLALWPLCRVRSDLQDHVIMLLRKMMYRQDVGGRLIAIRGFLCLILKTLIDAPGGALGGSDPSVAGCSQASMSQMSSLSGSGGVNLLQELSVVLRRALSQQAPVREALYKGLLQVLAADPGSHELLCELLLPHLRNYIHEDDQQLPPLQLQQCAGLVQGEATPIEPLPVLLSTVHRLATEHPAPVSGDWSTGIADNSSGALQACFSTIRTQLSRCELEHFELGGPADLNPLMPAGLLAQMHAANLLGVLEVVVGDVVMEAEQLKQRLGNNLDAGQVTRLGDELHKLFALHNQVYNLALEGSKSGAKKSKKKGSTAAADPADDGTEQQAVAAGQKRGRPSSSFTPVQKLAPYMSASCLAILCNAIADDGLLQLPNDADVTLLNQHVVLARDAGFRSFVLRSCCNLLEGAQSAAASAALLELDAKDTTAAAPVAAEVLQLGPALFNVVKLIMQTATTGGRSAGSASSSGGAADKPDSHSSDTLEQLSAAALLQLLKLANSTQQLAVLFNKLSKSDNGAQRPQHPDDMQVYAAGAETGADTPLAVASAVLPRLGQIERCITTLMENSCFKEAQIAAECVMLLGKQLGHVVPKEEDTDAGPAAAAHAQGRQQGLPAYVELSRWSESALQQDEPEVKSAGLAKVLLEMYIRYAPNDLAALKATVQEIQSLVGDTEQDHTQATQQHGTVLPLLMGSKTAQPSAAMPMGYIDECFGQVERLLAGTLKAGMVQDGDSSSVAQERLQLAREVCKRMQGLLECLAVMVNTIFAMPAVVDQQVRLLTRAYKVLASIAKAYQLPKPAVAAGKNLSKEFEDLVSLVHKDLTHRVYHFLTDEQEAQRGMKVNLNRIKREAKMIPTLIFNIEAWDKQLVATGRAVSKNLLKDARRATCRDFKINNPELKVAAAAAAAAAAGATGSGGAGGAPSGGSAPVSRQQSREASGSAGRDEQEVDMEQEPDEQEEEIPETDDEDNAENQQPQEEDQQAVSKRATGKRRPGMGGTSRPLSHAN